VDGADPRVARACMDQCTDNAVARVGTSRTRVVDGYTDTDGGCVYEERAA
jgi:hypothetical protein